MNESKNRGKIQRSHYSRARRARGCSWILHGTRTPTGDLKITSLYNIWTLINDAFGTGVTQLSKFAQQPTHRRITRSQKRVTSICVSRLNPSWFENQLSWTFADTWVSTISREQIYGVIIYTNTAEPDQGSVTLVLLAEGCDRLNYWTEFSQSFTKRLDTPLGNTSNHLFRGWFCD